MFVSAGQLKKKVTVRGGTVACWLGSQCDCCIIEKLIAFLMTRNQPFLGTTASITCWPTTPCAGNAWPALVYCLKNPAVTWRSNVSSTKVLKWCRDQQFPHCGTKAIICCVVCHHCHQSSSCTVARSPYTRKDVFSRTRITQNPRVKRGSSMLNGETRDFSRRILHVMYLQSYR